MKLARVSGTVVSTFNSPVFDHKRLLICDYLTPDGEPTGDYVIRVECHHAVRAPHFSAHQQLVRIRR